ncbi:hypothetical protein QTH87_25675 [Variovorax sp. J22P168]|uniref:hypothetical protein n=1 Tax=Variovorax jilinensis TaxID=3053513 RepID=UPI0025755D75|nr:hypothetical protein [Variovorax sp. J22P168]MDM0015855.1 hypothetical protein [Variovorax sp. J22P168]
MLTTDQKEAILLRAGVSVPPFPRTGTITAERVHEAEQEVLRTSKEVASTRASQIEQWAQQVEDLYVAYVAHRAAKSLHDDQAARTSSAGENWTRR